MHHFLKLREHLSDDYFLISFLGNLYTSDSLGSVSGVLFCSPRPLFLALFLYMSHNFVLESAHLKNWPPLPVLMDWLHAGETPNSQTKDFRGISNISEKDVTSLGPVHAISQLERHFLFVRLFDQGPIIPCSIWCLCDIASSLAPQWYSPNSLVLQDHQASKTCRLPISVPTQAKPDIRSSGDHQKSWNTGHVYHFPSALPREKLWAERFLLLMRGCASHSKTLIILFCFQGPLAIQTMLVLAVLWMRQKLGTW